MNNPCFLGIDTSNYTTSLCLVDIKGRIINEARQLLSVPEGEKGLRQSEALFQHVRNLPELVDRVLTTGDGVRPQIEAVSVSTKPRPTIDSYMPVFLPGEAVGRSIATTLKVPCFATTHQEGHLWAGLATAKGPRSFDFLAIHLSGGTSELVKCKVHSNFAISLEVFGGSSDLHAGQFVDRVGVMFGLPFPSGPHLEALAKKADKKLVIPSHHNAGSISFSGPLSHATRLVSNNEPANVARAVFISIARSLEKLMVWAAEKTGIDCFLLVGGVSANSLIRQELNTRCARFSLYFADPKYSTDNAYGTALFGGLQLYGRTMFRNILPDNGID